MSNAHPIINKRYRIDMEIGRGGMGIVYKATDITLNRPVAIKVLPPQITADTETFNRFRNEVFSTSRLEHPGIIRIYDAGVQGSYYYVMQYVDGTNLYKEIKKRKIFALKSGLPILMQVASALDFAHNKGFIHRDVKPENILLDQLFNAYLVDFGIVISDYMPKRYTRGFIGTPEYASPEHCKGDELTGASDQYSFAVIAYEMFTGRPPFERGEDANPVPVLVNHLNDAPPDPRTINPALPISVANALLRAMAKAPEDRFTSCTEFVRTMSLSVLPSSSISHKRNTGETASPVTGDDMKAPTSQRDSVNVKPDSVNVKPDSVNIKPDGVSAKPDNRYIKKDSVNIKPDGSNLKRDSVNVKSGKPILEQKPDATAKKKDYEKQEPEKPQQPTPVPSLSQSTLSSNSFQADPKKPDKHGVPSPSLPSRPVKETKPNEPRKLTPVTSVKPPKQKSGAGTLLVVFFILIMAGGIFFFLQANSSENLIKQGDGLHSSKKYRQAVETYKKAVSKSPDKPELYFKLALAEAMADDYKSATDNCDILSAKFPNYVKENLTLIAPIYAKYAKNLMESGDMGNSISFYEKARNIYPDNSEYSFELARIYKDSGEDKKAVELYEKLIATEPENTDYKLDLAALYIKMGNPELAIEFYENAISSGKQSPELYEKLGEAYLNLKNYDMSLKYLNRAVEEGKISAYTQIAKIYESKNDHKNAIGTIRKAYKQAPDKYAKELSAMLLKAANSDFSKNSMKTAATYYKEALAIDKDGVSNYSKDLAKKGDEFFNAKKYEQALAAYKKSSLISGDTAKISYSVLLTNYKLKNNNEVLNDYEKVLKLNKDDKKLVAELQKIKADVTPKYEPAQPNRNYNDYYYTPKRPVARQNKPAPPPRPRPERPRAIEIPKPPPDVRRAQAIEIPKDN